MMTSTLRKGWAILCALCLFALAAPVPAHAERWAPSQDREDGALIFDELAFPAGAKFLPWEGLEAIPAAAQERPKPPAPAKGAPISVKAPSAVLMEAMSGRVLFAQNPHERRNPASVTKIMTLIVAFDAMKSGKVSPQDKVVVSEEAAKQIGTIIFADANETFTFHQLLESVAVGSANDAAVSVAEHVSGSVEAFVAAMNAKAKELGMHDTQFQNPTGLSAEGHFTSAYDIALMSRHAARAYPELVKLTSIYGKDLEVPWRKNGPTFRLWNNNKLLVTYPGADGFKTGWTEAAGYCISASAVRSGVRMIAVIMGADSWKSRNADATNLLNYGFSNYTTVTLAQPKQSFGTVRVVRGRQPRIAAIAPESFGVAVAKGEQARVKTEVKLKPRVEAPLKAGDTLGEIIATLDGKELARADLVSPVNVVRANLWQSILQQVKLVFSL